MRIGGSDMVGVKTLLRLNRSDKAGYSDFDTTIRANTGACALATLFVL